MRKVVSLALLMLLAAGVAALLLRTVARTEATDEIVIPRGVTAVDVAVDTGDVVVSGLAGPVRVSARRAYALWGPDVSDRQDGATLVVRADCPGFGWLIACEVDLDVAVPPATRVRAESDAGTVTVQAVTGPVRAESDAGAVAVRRAGPGDVVASTNAGDVEVDAARAPARIEARSDAGDVLVRVPRGRYAIDADTTAGDVRIDGVVDDPTAPRVIVARTRAGSVTVLAR
ncbi:MAG: DUF4097 domain-containing protein [Thermoleophilia bacterium]|nr:DUF4097 domain-containing protein [Thermoleophilia bacterium]